MFVSFPFQSVIFNYAKAYLSKYHLKETLDRKDIRRRDM